MLTVNLTSSLSDNTHKIKYNDDLYSIIEFLHVKPGKGPAFVRTKLRSLTSGKVIDNTFNSGVAIYPVRVERRKFQFIFNNQSIQLRYENKFIVSKCPIKSA